MNKASFCCRRGGSYFGSGGTLRHGIKRSHFLLLRDQSQHKQYRIHLMKRNHLSNRRRAEDQLRETLEFLSTSCIVLASQVILRATKESASHMCEAFQACEKTLTTFIPSNLPNCCIFNYSISNRSVFFLLSPISRYTEQSACILTTCCPTSVTGESGLTRDGATGRQVFLSFAQNHPKEDTRVLCIPCSVPYGTWENKNWVHT